ncbi:hypothetical protein [Gimesia sp.]|uniref:hypothetical protein n=1 Tax=Gimesia sp. TaxID=2024833 RepID=UPI003A8C8BDE
MFVRQLIFAPIMLILLCYGCVANAADRDLLSGPYFLPGDAYFHTAVSEKVLKKLDDDSNFPFKYGLLNWQLNHAGYYSLSLGNQNQNLVKQIKTAYYSIRHNLVPLQLEVWGKSPNSVADHPPEGKTEFIEMNRLDLFFVNEDFDWKKYRFPIKYNEDWYKELSKFGFPNADYGSLVDTTDAILDSWRLSTQISPLSVKLPDVPVIKQQAIKAPMLATGRLKALMLINTKYKKYFKRKDHQQLFEITNEMVTPYYVKDGKWKEH